MAYTTDWNVLRERSSGFFDRLVPTAGDGSYETWYGDATYGRVDLHAQQRRRDNQFMSYYLNHSSTLDLMQIAP